MQKNLILAFILVLCVGCNDFTERRQKAKEARQQQTINDLRKLGEEMHSKHSSEQEADSTETEAPEKTSDSLQDNIDSTE